MSKDASAVIEKCNTAIGLVSSVYGGVQTAVGILQAIGILQKSTTLDDIKNELDQISSLITSGFAKLDDLFILTDWNNTVNQIDGFKNSAAAALEDATAASLDGGDISLNPKYTSAMTQSLGAIYQLSPDNSPNLWRRLVDDRMFYSDVWNGTLGTNLGPDMINYVSEYRLQLPAFCAAVATRMTVLAFDATKKSNIFELQKDATTSHETLVTQHDRFFRYFAMSKIPSSDEFINILVMLNSPSWFFGLSLEYCEYVWNKTPGGLWFQANCVCGAFDELTGVRVSKNLAYPVNADTH